MEKNVLKWQGGKSSLFYGPIKNYLPKELFDPNEDITFIDAFSGGGSVFLYILYNCPGVKRILINDYNYKLINLYNSIKNDIDNLVSRLKVLQLEYDNSKNKRDYYDLIKKDFNNYNSIWIGSNTKYASDLMLLNRTCFNGIYRENSKGIFNVPWGKKEKVTIFEENSLREISKLLNSKNIIFTSGDFNLTGYYIYGKTFIYLDPPYRPLSGSASFTSYTSSPFNDEEQKRLKTFCDFAGVNGANIMISNSYDPNDNFLIDLYSGYNIVQISANRSSGGKNATRGKILENLIMNYAIN